MNRNRFGTSLWRACGAAAARCRVRPAGRGPDDRQLDATSSGCRTRSTRRAATSPGCASSERRCAAGSRRARRPARRSGLPQGQAAQGGHRLARRLHRRARPAAGSADACARRLARQRHDGDGATHGDRRHPARATAAAPAASAAAPAAIDRSRHDRQTRGSEQGTRRGTQRDPGRAGDRRPAAARAELRHRAGRGSLRSHDRGRPVQGNDVLIPAGSVMRGVVSSVNKATRTDRKGSLTVVVRPGHRARPELPDARHRDPGDRERGHQG